MGRLETPIEDYLVERVEARGGRCPKLVDMGRRGFPDRSPMWPGADIHFIETKCEGGDVKALPCRSALYGLQSVRALDEGTDRCVY